MISFILPIVVCGIIGLIVGIKSNTRSAGILGGLAFGCFIALICLIIGTNINNDVVEVKEYEVYTNEGVSYIVKDDQTYDLDKDKMNIVFEDNIDKPVYRITRYNQIFFIKSSDRELLLPKDKNFK